MKYRVEVIYVIDDANIPETDLDHEKYIEDHPYDLEKMGTAYIQDVELIK